MRKTGLSKVSRLKTVLRWCACLVVCCVLALGGTTVFLIKPAQAGCNCSSALPTIISPTNGQIVYGTVGVQFNLPFIHASDTPKVCPCPNANYGLRDISVVTGFSAGLPSGLYATGLGMSIQGIPTTPGTYPCQLDIWSRGDNGDCCYNYARCTIAIVISPAGTGGTQQGGLPPPPPPPAAPTTYKFKVNIGPGLTEGKTEVFVDGSKKADLGGGESKEFTAAIGTSPVVSVKSPITGQQGNRFTVKGDAEKKVSEGDTSAYFDYAPAIYIEFVTNPSGITALSGTNWYNIGDRVQSSAPATVESGQSGTRYQFGYWALPNGQKSQMKSLLITASAPATITASYETQYKLTVSSAYGDDWSDWYPAGSQASWQAKTPQVPMSGIMGALGGKMKAVKSGGGITMDGPKNITVQYQPSYPWLVLLLIAAAVIGGGIFVYRRMAVARAAAPAAPAAADTAATQLVTKPKAATRAAAPPEKKAVATKAVPKAKATETKATKAKPAVGSKFCPKCGDPVTPHEVFCSNCGKKLK